MDAYYHYHAEYEMAISFARQLETVMGTTFQAPRINGF